MTESNVVGIRPATPFRVRVTRVGRVTSEGVVAPHVVFEGAVEIDPEALAAGSLLEICELFRWLAIPGVDPDDEWTLEPASVPGAWYVCDEAGENLFLIGRAP